MPLKKYKLPYLLVIVASLGYFVDIYDLILFQVVKAESLISLGYKTETELFEYGTRLFNYQMIGMLVGGLLWGVMGDKIGRVKVLFGSILLYSIANIGNAFVYDIQTYSIARFIAGVGLAGELGAGITLISETMEKDKRGIGTMIIVSFGALGAVLAALLKKSGLDWSILYIVGGVLGLLLLALRAGTLESGMYKSIDDSSVQRGNFFMLFKTKERFIKYLTCIGVGVPIWFIIAVLMGNATKFATLLHVNGKVHTEDAIMYSYIGLCVGDIFSGMLSQLLKSRKKVVLTYLIISVLFIILYLVLEHISVGMFYFMCFALGAGTGYWALFVTIASEQFGTNIRSTVTNTVPNFVRGSVWPISSLFKYLSLTCSLGMIYSGYIVGAICLFIAFVSLYFVKESFHKDLDYLE